MQTFNVIDKNGKDYPIRTLFGHAMTISRGVFHSTTVDMDPILAIPFLW